MQAYSDPKRASDPYALPDVEIFKGYRHECPECETEIPLFPDYYGLLYPNKEECPECQHVGLKCLDTKVSWYYWYCFPGCLPDSAPFGPFETVEKALEDAQSYSEED